MENESFDIVTLDDTVIGHATDEDRYAKKLSHRIVHILLFNKKGEMAVQLRSAKERFCPLHWSTSVGGHVQLNECYEEAAHREMQEEIGLKAAEQIKPRFAHKDIFYLDEKDTSFFKILVTFTAEYDGDFEVNHESEDIYHFSLVELREKIEKGEKFHPELLFILKKHYF